MKLFGLDVILKTLKVFSLSMLFHACLWNLELSREKSILSKIRPYFSQKLIN